MNTRAVHSISAMEIYENTIIFPGENGKISLKIYREGLYHVEYRLDKFHPDKTSRDTSEDFYTDQLEGKELYDLNNISHSDDGKEYTLKVGKDRLTMSKADGLLTVFHNEVRVHGGMIGSEDTVLPRFPMRVLGGAGDETRVRFNFKLEDEDRFFGLGDKAGGLNKRNRRFRMDNRDALGYNASFSDPLYKSIPFLLAQNSENHTFTGLFFPVPRLKEIDLGVESSYFYSVEMTGGPFSYMVFTGANPWEILEKYTWISGRPALPPLYTFGFLGSSMNYVEDDDADEKVTEYFNRIEEYGIPCEGFYFSSGYLKADNGERYTFKWNKKKFPDPKASMKRYRDRGYHIASNIKPGFLVTHPDYEVLDKKGYFIKNQNGQSYVEYYWGNNASFIDLTNSDALDWWKSQLKSKLIDYGISGIWNDNNELELEDQGIDAQKIRSAYPVLMAKASWDIFKETDSGKRPWVISRSGGAGLQKYARTWTGDNVSDWESMKYNLLMGLGLGLSGIPFYGHDIGGFFGDHPDEKQFIRWCQTAVFQPRFVIHSWNEDGRPTELWSYSESISVLKELVQLHYEFMPYIYNTAIEASLKGIPMERPLALAFSRDNRIDPDSVHYMFGEDILVLSAVEKGEEQVSCYLPEGCSWMNNRTGEIYAGGSTVKIDYPYYGVSYLQKTGSVVTTAPGCGKLNTGFFSSLKMNIIPEAGKITQREYWEDDGESTLDPGSFNRYSLEIDYKSNKGKFTIRKEEEAVTSKGHSGKLKLSLPEKYIFEESGKSELNLDTIPNSRSVYFKERRL